MPSPDLVVLARLRCRPGRLYGYNAPRRPEATVLYGIVSSWFETFLARPERRERQMLRFVDRVQRRQQRSRRATPRLTRRAEV